MERGRGAHGKVFLEYCTKSISCLIYSSYIFDSMLHLHLLCFQIHLSKLATIQHLFIQYDFNIVLFTVTAWTNDSLGREENIH